MFNEAINEAFYNFHTSPNINMVIKSKMMGWAEHVASMEEMINAYNILFGLPEWKIQFWRHG
jgi:hypothetical protein